MTRRAIAIKILGMFEAVEPNEYTEDLIQEIEKYLTLYKRGKK